MSQADHPFFADSHADGYPPSGARLTPEYLRQQTPEIFLTRRLRLEKIHADHAEALRSAVLQARDTLAFIDWARGPWDLAQARRFCRDSRRAMDREGRFLTYLIFEQARRTPDAPVSHRGAYVGLLDLHQFDFSVPRCQIGYVGDARVAGQGLMREAALALIEQAHAWGLVRIEAWCDPRNHRSLHFAQALGLQREGLLRQAARDPDGRLCDQVLLARLADDPLPL